MYLLLCNNNGKWLFRPEMHKVFLKQIMLLSYHLMLEKSLAQYNLTMSVQSPVWPWTSRKNKTLIFCAMWNCSFGVTWAPLWRLGQCLLEFACKWALCHGKTISSNQKMYLEHRKIISGTVRPPFCLFTYSVRSCTLVWHCKIFLLLALAFSRESYCN